MRTRFLMLLIVLALPALPARGAPPADPVIIEVVSGRADTVTGGDALLRITGDVEQVLLDGQDVTAAFDVDGDGHLRGIVDGMDVGEHEVLAIRGDGAGASLVLRNHPLSGPVFSGPHLPLICRNQQSGLAAPSDPSTCAAPTVIEWFYRSSDGTFRTLDPSQPYPDDIARTMTTTGADVPFIVRVETAVINRGATKIMILDDPAARAPGEAYRPTAGWNERLQYSFGGGCGTGYHQGSLGSVDALSLYAGFLGQGYAHATSTLNALGNACNDVLSAETTMMVTERFIERYGEPLYVVGEGGSGGAIMQYMLATAYPGLLDGGLPYSSFPDNTTVTMSIFDCRAMRRVFDANPALWNPHAQAAVTGFAHLLTCIDWDDLYGDLIVPDEGCHGSIPRAMIYDPQTNRDGVRCTIQDSNRNIYGVDPATGFARRPYDNVGVQYGLRALQEGEITPLQFLDLNAKVGGFDIDGRPTAERTAADPGLLERLYRTGRVVSGGGGLADIPLLDQQLYIAEHAAAGLEVHDRVRPFQLRARLEAAGAARGTHLIWSYATNVPGDWGPMMDRWMTAIAEDDRAHPDASSRVLVNRPVDAVDRCYLTPEVHFDEPARYDEGRCSTLLRPHATPRMTAGGPLAEDILKCALRPIDAGEYPATMTALDLAQLGQIFPDGVCDWTVPGVGQVPIEDVWFSFGTDAMQEPVTLGPSPTSTSFRG